jgi:uncharacterized protein (DUF3820 family)
MGRPQTAMAVGKQQNRIMVNLPEAAQHIQCCHRKRHEPIFIALRISHMNALPCCIDIANLEA